MTYLLDHPPASPQYRYPRREVLSGIVVVHTTESVMDNVGPDTGAENVARFISERSDPGSYHELVDADSVVPLVPDGYESFQVAVDGHNRHAWGISFACRSSDLNPDSEWTRRVIAIAGVRIREFWLRNGFDPNSAARWISRTDAVARRGPGLVTHGTVQPADRSDAWTTHPRRAELEQMLVSAITQEPDDVTPEQMAQLAELTAQRVIAYGANPTLNPGTIIDSGARNALGAIHTVTADPTSGIRTLVLQLLGRTSGSTIDPASLAAAIADSLGDDIARQVSDELARRLAS